MSEPFGQQILVPTGVVRASQARKDPMGKLSPTCSTRRRPIAVVVFVSAIALVSPAGIVRAQTGGTSNPVTVSPSGAVGVDLAAAAQYNVKHHNAWKDYEDVMILATLNGAAKMAANTGHPMTTQDYNTLAAQVQNWLDARAPQNQTKLSQTDADKFRYVTDVLSSIVNQIPKVGPVLSASVGGFAKLEIDQLERTLDPSKQGAATLERYDTAIKSTRFAADRAQESADLAKNDPQFAKAVNPWLHDLTGLDTTNSHSDFKSLYPDVVPTLSANIDGSFSTNTSDLMNQYESIVSNTRSDTSTDMADLKSVSDYQLTNVFPADPSTNPSPLPPGNTDNPDQRQALRQLKLDAAQSSITALSKLIGLSDPQLAQQVATVGGAAVQIGEAVSTYLHTTETLTSAVSGLAGAALTGNIIGAAVDIFSLFDSTSGPSPDQVYFQQIEQQIQALSQQIDQLHQDMNTRFDRVDASLDNILTVLNQNFTQINYQLGTLNGNVHDIQTGLLDIEAQLNRMEQYLFAWTTALSKEQFIQTMDGCLGYRARTGKDIGFTRYATCENAAYAQAHDTALDQLWAGLDTPDYTDGNIYPILTNFPLSVDVNYLAQFPAKSLQLPSLSNARLANPNEWALGVRAYLQLAGEWPQYASQIASSRLDDLINVGAALRQAVQNANSIKNGNAISGNQPLFTAVSNKYSIAGGNLQSAMATQVSSFTQDPSNHLQGLNLWGGSKQTSTYVPAVLSSASMPACNDASKAYAVPSNLVSLMSSVPRLAEQLGVGNLSLCLDHSTVPAFTGLADLPPVFGPVIS